jgi:hypothetical protein
MNKLEVQSSRDDASVFTQHKYTNTIKYTEYNLAYSLELKLRARRQSGWAGPNDWLLSGERAPFILPEPGSTREWGQTKIEYGES